MIAIKAQNLRRTAGLISFMLLSAVVLAKSQETSSPPKTAAQQFKNIQVLKDIPADQLVPTMQFISGSLGVDCEFCHVERAMDKDDKEEKKTARKMMTMQLALNKNHFNNEVEVTCYSCHRGSLRPVGTPILPAETSRELGPDRKNNIQFENLPTVDEIFEHYLTAVGGADALHKISTRIQRGTIDAMGEQYSVEVYSE